jgi:hypothetical protein
MKGFRVVPCPKPSAPPRARTALPNARQEALQLASAGVPAAMIARSLGVNQSTVSRWLVKSSGSDVPCVSLGGGGQGASGLEKKGPAPAPTLVRRKRA